MSHNTPEGRQIIKFACHGDHSTVERSIGGVDAEVGPLRTISTVGFEELRRLEAGEEWETWLQPDTANRPVLVRFRHD